MAELFSVARTKNQLTESHGKNRRIKVAGDGKVEIQNQDSHFPTTPSACGSKEKNISKKRRQS